MPRPYPSPKIDIPRVWREADVGRRNGHRESAMDQRDIFGYESRMMAAERQDRLAALVGEQVGVETVRIDDLRRVAGASRETWSFVASSGRRTAEMELALLSLMERA